MAQRNVKFEITSPRATSEVQQVEVGQLVVGWKLEPLIQRLTGAANPYLISTALSKGVATTGKLFF